MWVLILNSDYVAKPPAVIGGYSTREEAERVGDLATSFENLFENKEGVLGWYSSVMPFYTSYIVIPGAAAAGPLAMTSCALERDEHGRITRRLERSVEQCT